MAQKRIKMVRTDIFSDKIRLLYDDGSQGEIDTAKCKASTTQTDMLVGLTLKQAKMKLGIKN